VRKVIWAGASVIAVAALAIGALQVFRAGGTVATIAGWLERDCTPEVKVESKHLPTPINFEPAERGFMDAAREVKFITCEGVNGSIFYYRFASIGARLRAAAAYPEFYRSSVSCAKGTEVLFDNLIFSQALTAKYCRRLHFQVEPPLHRSGTGV
jgi:hypothetical protein